MPETSSTAVSIALAGDTYFYQNPLADDGHHRRQLFFHTACCPPSIAPTPVRFVAVPYYAWANREPGGMQVWLREQQPTR